MFFCECSEGLQKSRAPQNKGSHKKGSLSFVESSYVRTELAPCSSLKLLKAALKA